MMKISPGIKILMLTVLLSAAPVVPTAAFGQSFKEANQFYKENKYDQAIEAYEKILQSGFESGNLYYNLGNSYFKKGELGRAVLNYERSRLFIPADSDLRSNYNFVRSSLNVPSGQGESRWFLRWIDLLFDGAGINGLTVMVSVLWLGILVLLAACLFSRGLRQFAAPVIAFCAAALIISSIALARRITHYEHGAVVIIREAEAKFEPRPGATTYFKASEGSPVIVLDRAAGWAKIRRPDAKIGWVPSPAIAGIRE
jgi:tetratricopeptide (TPR) repeat protein